MKITKQRLKEIIKEELGQPIKEELGQSVYAYVEIPGEGGTIVEGDSVEEVRKEGGYYGDVVAIFTATILEGEL